MCLSIWLHIFPITTDMFVSIFDFCATKLRDILFYYNVIYNIMSQNGAYNKYIFSPAMRVLVTPLYAVRAYMKCTLLTSKM